MKIPKQLVQCALGGLLCLSLLGAFTTSDAKHVSIGRYLSVPLKAQNDQQHLLQQHIQIKFPKNVLTIKQALQFILRFSGYRLADNGQRNSFTNDMLNQSLPEVDRTLGPMTLAQGLNALAGDAFYLLVDPVHRLLSYQIKPQYQHLFTPHITIKNNSIEKGFHHDLSK